jgi:hypothetical protein
MAAGLSVFRRSSLVSLPGWVYFDASLCIILTGLTFTTLFKRRKRLQNEKEKAMTKGSLSLIS